MHDGPSPVFKVIRWRGIWIYLYRLNVGWVWKRWRINKATTRLFAGPIEVSW